MEKETEKELKKLKLDHNGVCLDAVNCDICTPYVEGQYKQFLEDLTQTSIKTPIKEEPKEFEFPMTQDLWEFFRDVIPELTDDEVLYMYLQARRKYFPELKKHDPVIDRTLIREKDFSRIIDKIKRLSALKPLAIDRKTELPIPEHVQTIYIDINPKSIDKGMISFIKEFMDKQYAYRKGKEHNKKSYKNPDIMLFANIHKSYSRKPYAIIDVDEKDEALLQHIIKIINQTNDWCYNNHKDLDKLTLIPLIRWITETQGGYHIILNNVSKIVSTVYINLQNTYPHLIGKKIEFKRNCTTPVVGTYQNNFLVRRKF